MRTTYHRLVRSVLTFLLLAASGISTAGLPATINLSGLPGSTVPGASISVTAGVTGSLGAASGNASFTVRDVNTGGNVTPCASVALDASGNAPCSFTAPGNGLYDVIVSYSGDAIYDASSASFRFNTQQADVTIALGGLPSSTVPGATISVISNVSSASPLGTPTGLVSFDVRDVNTGGVSTACSNVAIDVNGNSPCTFIAPSSGLYDVRVFYSGDTPNAATNASFRFNTAQASVTITLSGLPASTVPGATISLISHLSTTSPIGTPTGNVTFDVRDVNTGSVSVACSNVAIDSNGNSPCTFIAPSNGLYDVRVFYSGDTPNAATNASFRFNTAQASVTITLSGLPSATVPGASISVISNVASTSPLGRPTGTVTMDVRDVNTGSVSVACSNVAIDSNGNSPCTFIAPSSGLYDLRVFYSGDTPNAATNASFRFNTAQASVTITLSGLPSATVPGASISVISNVASGSPLGRPTGTVTMDVRDVNTGSVSVACSNVAIDSNGNSPCTFTAPSSGLYDLRVFYGGDTPNAPTNASFRFNTQQASVTITVSGLPPSAAPGASISVISNVASASPLGRPTGLVTMDVRDVNTGAVFTPCSNVAIDSNGNSPCTFTAPSSGLYDLRVFYSGDTANAATNASFRFNTAQGTVTISMTGLPATTYPGTSTPVVAGFTSPLGLVTGTANFDVRDANTGSVFTPCASVAIDASGNAPCSFTAPAAGTYDLVVTYSGDASNAGTSAQFRFNTTTTPVVTNTNNSGPGSLRDTIAFVNANCAGQTITFNIPGTGVHTIQPVTQLPAITCGNVVVDGYSQPGSFPNSATVGWNGSILIELNGALGAGTGIEIKAATVRVQGLSFTGFISRAIWISAPIGTLGAEVYGNFIGLAPDGVTSKPNSYGIVNASTATGLSVGGLLPSQRNVISGSPNGGIALQSGDLSNIVGNYIGTDASGLVSVPNGFGVYLYRTTRTQIQANLFSGNSSTNASGIYLDADANDSTIRDNVIGLNASGSAALPNVFGIRLFDAFRASISNNVIAGNTQYGIDAHFSTATITGNHIGTDATDSAAFGNGVAGIVMDRGSSGLVSGNTIRSNGTHGVVAQGTGIQISANSIYQNGSGLGINLQGVPFLSAPANDPCDVDTGGNGLANYPVLTNAISNGASLTVGGTLNSAPSTTFRIEFFASPSTENAGNRSGKAYLGFLTVTTDGACNATIAGTVADAPPGSNITATSTDPSGNTSSFSNAVVVAGAVSAPTLSAVRPSSGSVAGGAAVALDGNNLDSVTSVTVGGVSAPILRQSKNTLLLAAPAHAAGAVDIVVTNAAASATLAAAYTYVNNDDVARDFSFTNPSPRWTYGWSPTRGGSFTQYDMRTLHPSGIDFWTRSGAEPLLGHNSTAGTIAPAGANPMPAGAFALHPGPGGENSVARWTVPVAGTYRITGSFTGADTAGTTTDVSVLRNNNAAAPLFAGVVNGFGASQGFSVDVSLGASETIEFTVGYGGNGYASDTTLLAAVISPIAAAPAVSLSPTSLTFASQGVGTTSPAQTVTLTNIGTAPLNIRSVSISPEFAMTACTSPIAPGASCTVGVTFTPAGVGTRTGTIAFTTDAPGSPHIVTLSGTGISTGNCAVHMNHATMPATVTQVFPAPGGSTIVPPSSTATLSAICTGATISSYTWSNGSAAPSVSVPTPAVGSSFTYSVTLATSAGSVSITVRLDAPAVGAPVCAIAPQNALLPTTSPPPLTVNATDPAGYPSGTCNTPAAVTYNWSSGSGPLTLTSGQGTATATYTMSPSSPGFFSLIFLNVSNASGPGPTAVASVAQDAFTFTPSSLTFPSTAVGATSAPQAATIGYLGSVQVPPPAARVTGPFTITSNCPTPMAGPSSCTIDVRYVPTVVGTGQTGTLTFTYFAGSVQQTRTIALSGSSTGGAAVSLTPSSLAFGSQNVGTASAAQTATLTNTGNVALAISLITTGTSGDFAQTNACPASLAPGASCTIAVKFQPTAAGTRTAALSVFSNASGSPHSVALSGTGVSTAPAVSLTPTSLTFASRTVGTTSPAQTITLANVGNAPLSISSIAVNGDYAMVSGCGTTLLAGGSCNISVTFTPLVVGTRLGAITVTDNASGSPHVVSLSGSGVTAAAPVLQISPAVIDFPPQQSGSQSDPETVIVKNVGTAPMTFSFIGVSGEFAIVPPVGAGAPACPVTLDAGESCRLALVFRPRGTNQREGVLTIVTNAGAFELRVVGTGMVPEPPQLVLGSRLDFGEQAVGTTRSLSVELRNTSQFVATITTLAASGDFTVSETCATIAAGASCSPLVTFQPTQVGARSGSLTVRTLRDANPYTVLLTGVGIENNFPVLEVSPLTIGFGNSFLGQSGNQQVVIRNTGHAPLIVSRVEFTGDFFAAGGNCVGTIAAGGSCQVSVTFLPSIPGNRSGTMVIFSNATGSPHGVSLSGVGCYLPSPGRARFGTLLCGN